MSFLSKLFNKDKNYQKELKNYYISNNYKIVPIIPPENEAERILKSHEVFPASIVPKTYMEYLTKDKLIRGHFILLWWYNNKRTNKNNFPKYFLYNYGIDCEEESKYLIKNNYMSNSKELSEKGKNLLNQNIEIINQHKAKKSFNKDGSVEYFYSSLLKGKEKEQALYKEAKKQIRKSLENLTENNFDQYIIMGDLADSKGKKLDGKHFYVSEAKIGVNAPPFSLTDRSSISSFIDRRAFEESLKKRGL